jgi:hypothetical protein
MMPRECETCGRPDDLVAVPSALDEYAYDQCRTCFENRCQDWRAIGNYLRTADWQDLADEIRRAITVWQDERYVPVLDGMKRLLRQQMVPRDPEPPQPPNATLEEIAEEEAQMAAMMEAMRAVTRPPQITPTPRRFWRTAGQFALWCLGFGPARSKA